MPINKFGEQKMMTKLQLKKLLTCILLTMLVTLNIRGQALCVIDGIPLPDSLLHVTINEMRSDSAKEIVANRLGLFPPYAIESIQIFSTEEQIKQGNNLTCCKTPRDIVFIRTNSFAELQWIIDGRPKKPHKWLTIIEYMLSPKSIIEAMPKGIKSTDISALHLITYRKDPRQEMRPTIVIETKKASTKSSKRRR